MSEIKLHDPSAPIDLDADASFLTVVIGGYEFSFDAFDAMDELARLDRTNRLPMQCLACAAEFPGPAEDDNGKPVCPKCGASGDNLRRDPRYFDTVIAWLKDRYGVPRCSWRGAAAFYDRVIEHCHSLKKTSLNSADSSSGTDSTAETSTPGNGESG